MRPARLAPCGVCGWHSGRGTDARLGSELAGPTGALNPEIPGVGVEPYRRSRPAPCGGPGLGAGRGRHGAESNGCG